MKSINPYRIDVLRTIILLTTAYALTAIFWRFILEYNLLRSDALSYWQNSLNWQTPFHSFHVPGYPLLIALTRGITLNTIPPILLMMSITLTAFIINLLLIYALIKADEVDSKYAIAGMYLFALWPFVGLVFTVYPIADTSSIALYLAGLYFIQRNRIQPATFFWGLSLITHKVMWIFVGLTFFAYLFYTRPRISWRLFIAVSIMFLPIVLLWISGSIHHNSLIWLISSNLSNEFASHSSLPILDGLLGTLLFQGGKGFIKGGILIGIAIIAITLLFNNYKLTTHNISQNAQYGIAISASVLLLFVILNQHEIWGALRFSKLLALPLMWSTGHKQFKNITARLNSITITLFLLLLFFSQFVFVWYMARILYPTG